MALATECLPEREPLRLKKKIGLALRRFRDALRYRDADDELAKLSDRYLRDVGVDRHDISSKVETEITGITLLDTGWAKPPRRLR